ncbi:MAG: SH3 domain-containing protein [Oculatellaceae cyanobacterium Prado106]|jgi:hypothetical protein|nr:SH3 domain-containing protein [Oculatellaceae cyanobacterium Prado106]
MDDKAGHVYFLSDGTGRYKIGMCQLGRIDERVQEINGRQASRPIEKLWHIDVSDRVKVEQELHARFELYKVHNEWFQFSKDMLPDVQAAYQEAEQKYPVPKKHGSAGFSGAIALAVIVIIAIGWVVSAQNRRSPSFVVAAPEPEVTGSPISPRVAAPEPEVTGTPMSPRVVALETARVDCGKTGGMAVHVRSQPTDQSTRLTTVPCGESVTVENKVDGWSQVRFGSFSGYMASNFLTEEL